MQLLRRQAHRRGVLRAAHQRRIGRVVNCLRASHQRRIGRVVNCLRVSHQWRIGRMANCLRAAHQRRIGRVVNCSLLCCHGQPTASSNLNTPEFNQIYATPTDRYERSLRVRRISLVDDLLLPLLDFSRMFLLLENPPTRSSPEEDTSGGRLFAP